MRREAASSISATIRDVANTAGKASPASILSALARSLSRTRYSISSAWPMVSMGLRRRRRGPSGADDDGIRELVVPALLARIECDPDQPETQRDHRDIVGEIAADALADRRVRAGG